MSKGAESDWGRTFDDLWRRLGPESKTALLDLVPDDWSFAGKRILDFGSGYGRTLAHFRREAEEAEFWGVDVDAPAIARLERELCPPMHAVTCRPDPPLDFEDGYFDLAWAISVFTHLSDNSVAWLLELHRVLRPGGLLIATFMGRWHAELFTSEPWDEDKVGMNVLRHDQPHSEGGPMVLMSEWWIRAHWGRVFEIIDIAPEIHNQSWALMRRRDVKATVAGIERPGDDPRELLAVRENLRQVRRELEFAHRVIEVLQDRHAAELADVQRNYETASSWRLTRPLREGRRLVRSARSRFPS